MAANSAAVDRPVHENRGQSEPKPGMNRVLFLLSLSVLINYIDRSNLSIAAPLIKDELFISASQLGTLLSAFFWSYALMQIPAGWLVDRFDVKWVFAAGFFLWTAPRVLRDCFMASLPCSSFESFWGSKNRWHFLPTAKFLAVMSERRIADLQTR